MIILFLPNTTACTLCIYQVSTSAAEHDLCSKFAVLRVCIPTTSAEYIGGSEVAKSRQKYWFCG